MRIKILKFPSSHGQMHHLGFVGSIILFLQRISFKHENKVSWALRQHHKIIISKKHKLPPKTDHGRDKYMG